MEMISIKLYQKKGKKRIDGKSPIYYVLTKGSERKLIATKKYLQPQFFDNEKGIVLKGADNSIKLNAFFKREMTRLDDIMIDLSNEGKEITFERVEAMFNNDFSKDFIPFLQKELKLQRGLIADKTYVGYQSCIRNLIKYQPEIPFNKISYEWLTQYKHYLVTVKKRKTNGYYQDFATIKKFWHIALTKGEVKSNPFKDFKLQTEETQRNWNPKAELLKLYDLLNDRVPTDKIVTEAVKNTLRHYLFSCFTGLRFGDKKLFGNVNIVDDRIQLKTSKTGKIVHIPFNDQARELLEAVLARPLKQSGSRVNDDLDKCMKAVDIKKHITYHCSRHTFAINCIINGIDIITVRDWLGHKSVTTTEIYAKMADQYKDQNMKKLNNFFAVA